MTKFETKDFDYKLPKELIASVPTQKRDHSRLMVVNDENFLDTTFNHIIDFINPNDLLVVNNSKVIKARIFGHKPHGGKVEMLLENIIDPQTFSTQIKANKPIKLGSEIYLENNLVATVTQHLDGSFICSTNITYDMYEYLEQYGHVPLPPYMNRTDNASDLERYQTVYAKEKGSIAAPTAGLHFSTELLDKIKAKGVKIASVTLHVGLGTFKSVNTKYITDHVMHKENYHVSAETIELIKQTKSNGHKVYAVGTTSMRTLETIAKQSLNPGFGSTNIFITPGFKFQIVDKLITNFHVPKSTLLMLVSAFAGIDTIKQAYAHAIKNHYRFFSYGDAMLLTLKE